MPTYSAKLYEKRVGWLFFDVPEGENPYEYLNDNIDSLWNDTASWSVKDSDYELWGKVDDGI